VEAEQAPSAPGVVSIRSPRSFVETLERLNQAIRERGLTVFAVIDHRGEAERVGLSMHSAKVLVIGNPRAGTPLMVAAPLLALDLPLKVLVWKDQSSAVWASYTDPDYLIDRFGAPRELARNIAGIRPLIDAAFQAGDEDKPAAT
jgi:uncharacterized protein (DUF302 family)